ncbi:MAG: hypothetical protein CMJ25_20725 [Phycisphaerae bacterium]|nr:hypothetical protein [Phycisphaerae bacterium]|tara:strand:- start:1233 stop:1424 length:192 start_codon:yes stop_codon:yes gene_type:complete
MSGISRNDVEVISHINYVSNNLHDLTDDLYEDLMERDNQSAKEKAKYIVNLMEELIQSLSDDI